MTITSLYEVTYKDSKSSRKVHTAIRCGQAAADVLRSDEFTVSVRCLGEYAGDWCLIPA